MLSGWGGGGGGGRALGPRIIHVYMYPHVHFSEVGFIRAPETATCRAMQATALRFISEARAFVFTAR